MDPLSVTASVIAIIQAINKTISVCLSFRAALKEAPSGLTQVIDETRGLRDILEALQRTIDIGTDTVPNNSRNAACNQIWELIRDIIPQCEAVLVDLNEQLGNPNPSTSISIGKRDKLTAAVRWRWLEPQVKSSFERLERCKSRLIAALSVHQAYVRPQLKASAVPQVHRAKSLAGRFSSMCARSQSPGKPSWTHPAAVSRTR
jgi:hypothetical protein